MREPSSNFPKLLEIFNFETKRELERYCANLVVLRSDFAALILTSQYGALHPYQYANHFDRKISSHLIPSNDELAAFAGNGMGRFKTKAANKFVRKTFQLVDEQRTLAAHLFYTPSHERWYLFYFDNRDAAEIKNHAKMIGPHMHLVCSLWPRLSLREVWEKVLSGKLTFSNKIYLRFKRQ